MPAGCNLTSAPLHLMQVNVQRNVLSFMERWSAIIPILVQRLSSYNTMYCLNHSTSRMVVDFLCFHCFYNTLVHNEFMHRRVLFCGMTTVKCVVSTVCSVQSAQSRGVKARGVSECMLCMRLRKVCDTGLMPWPGATTCASTQHQEERG